MTIKKWLNLVYHTIWTKRKHVSLILLCMSLWYDVWIQNLSPICSLFSIYWFIYICTVQDIIRLPRLFRFLQRPLAKLISTFRAPKSKEGYASIGGGSPLRKITDEQVKSCHPNHILNYHILHKSCYLCVVCQKKFISLTKY